ncbi:MAG TPA: DUF2690 domain-containing protein [Streptosporangiaceae bacterium]|nr:DUF2690 domain-containing protein [Streptosporangiaceae bacterium]
MGRPERAVDPELGPLSRLACDLRQLRRDAGSPSYRELARRTRYSASVLSRAAGGRDLPSLAVTLAYVNACGGDTRTWEARWRDLAVQQLPAAPPAAHGAGPGNEPGPGTNGTTSPPGPSDPRDTGDGPDSGEDGHRGAPRQSRARAGRRPYRVAGVGLLGVVVVGVAGGFAAMAAAGPDPARPEGQTVPRTVQHEAWQLPSDGADPKAAHCTADAVTIAAATVRVSGRAVAAGHVFPAGTAIGTVELRYSARCHAAWARVTPTEAFDHPLSGRETVGVVRPTDGASTSFRPGFVEEAYSDVLRAGRGCVSAYATFDIADGHTASARTPCRQHP